MTLTKVKKDWKENRQPTGGKLKNLGEMLDKTEVFLHLTSKEKEELVHFAHKRNLRQGEIVFHQGDEWPYVFWILNGELRSYISAPDGRTFVTGVWKAGMEFWGHSIFDGKGMPSTLETSLESIVYWWNGEEAMRCIVRNSDAVRALLGRQTRLIRGRREIIYNLAFNPVTSRVAKLVIELFSESESTTVQRELTLEDMAARIATSPEVVCRVLQQFHMSGFVEMKRATITLNDRESLEKLISPD